MTEMSAQNMVRALVALKSFCLVFLKRIAARPALVAAISVFSISFVATAGTLTPPGSPSGTMFSLSEIYGSIAGTFSSGSITANQNGSLMENLKYIESNLAWASGSNNIWNLNSGNVGIASSSPVALLSVEGSLIARGHSLIGNAAGIDRYRQFGNEFPRPAALTIQETADAAVTAGTGFITALQSTLTVEPTSVPVNFSFMRGVDAMVTNLNTDAWNYTNGYMVGMNIGASKRGTGLITNVVGGLVYAQNDSSSALLTATNVSGLRVQATTTSLAQTTNEYGLYIESLLGGNNVTNGYALYINAPSAGSTDRYSVYAPGTTSNYFGGNVGIGTASPAEKLAVAGNIVPSVTNTYSLGTSTLRWANLFATNASISNNLEVSGTASVSQLYVAGTIFNPAIAGGWTDGGASVYLTTSSDNVGIGTSTPGFKLEIGTPGDMNLASSGAALRIAGGRVLHTKGTQNVFVGAEAGGASTTSQNNAAVGYRSFYTGLGSWNTAVGSMTLYSTQALSQANVAVGTEAMYSNQDGYGNIAMGYRALYSNVSGYYNTAIGRDALSVNTANYNTAIGFRSLYSNTTGYWNLGIGPESLETNTTGYQNTAVGVSSLISNDTGHDNTAFGFFSLANNTTGIYNTANGANALNSNTTGSYSVATGYRALAQNVTGGFNTAYGTSALRLNTSGSDNVAVGASAGYSFTGSGGVFIGRSAGYSTTGANNSAVGYQALYSNTGGISNSAFGYQSLYSNLGGLYNTAIGGSALYSNTSGVFNTAVGVNALYANTSGQGNTATGVNALRSNTTAEQNTAFGMQALYSNETGFFNTAAGYNALYTNVVGQYNSAFGTSALANNEGSFNTAIGAYALFLDTTGEHNTATGYYALRTNGTGSNNTANGNQALYSNETGNFNTALGSGALRMNNSGSDNVSVGASAGYSFTGDGGVFIGRSAGYSTTAAGDSALGFEALFSNTSGQNNTALGYQALRANTTAHNNVAIGWHSLYTNSTGYQNVAAGVSSLVSNTTGMWNTALGHAALSSNNTGYSNTATGFNALAQNTTGYGGTATGLQSLAFNSTGLFNTAVGYQALYSVVINSNNTALGYRAGNFAVGSGNVFLGSEAGYQEHGSNTLWIDNASTASSSAFIYGELDTDWLKIGANTSVSGNFEITGYVGNNWRPLLDTTYTLGDSTHRWANLFASNASISGTLEATVASVSQLFIGGIENTANVASALDFDDFLDSMSLDADTSIASGGHVLTIRGNVGIGTAVPQGLLYVGDARFSQAFSSTYASAPSKGVFVHRLPSTVSFGSGLYSQALTGTAVGAQSGVGVHAVAQSASISSTGTFNLYGVYGLADHVGSNTANLVVGVTGIASNHGLGSAAGFIGLNANTNAINGADIPVSIGVYGRGTANGAGSTITSHYNFLGGPTFALSGGVITNMAGYAQDSMTGASNNTYVLLGTSTIPAGNWGIYSATTNPSYFAGHASIGGNFELTGFVSSNLTPLVTNTYSLGTSALRWANLFAVNASISNNLEISGTASVSQLFVGGYQFGWPLEAPAGSVTSPSFAFDGFDGMGMFRSSTTMVLQSKNATPDLAGRSRLSLGEEFFSLSAVRSEDAAQNGTLQCYDEGGAVPICRFDIYDGTNLSTTRFYPTLTSFGTNATISGTFGPATTNAYDLGSQALRWRSIYVSSGSFHIGAGSNEGTIGYETSGTQGLTFKPAGSTVLFVGDSGNVGIASNSPSEKLGIVGNLRVDGGMRIGNNQGICSGGLCDTYEDVVRIYHETSEVYAKGLSVGLDFNPAVNDPPHLGWGITGSIFSNTANVLDQWKLVGVAGGAVHGGSGDAEYIMGVEGASTNENTGRVTNMYGVSASVANFGGGDVTYGMGVNVESPVGSTFDNLYGVYVGAQTQGTNNWNIYSTGATTRNFFAGHASVGANFELVGLASLSNTLWTRGGNVGIGTTNPAYIFDLTKTGTFIGDGDYAVARFTDSTQEAGVLLGYDTVSGLGVITAEPGAGANGGLSFGTWYAGSHTEKMRLTAHGNLGIGTGAPNSKLYVTGDFAGSSDSLLTIASASGTWLTVLENGNVGIGVATPGTKLDVGGSASVSGNFELTGYMSGNWRPTVDGLAELGDATHRWANLFAMNASLSGSMELGGYASASAFYGNAQNMTLSYIGNSTYRTLQDLQNIFHSAGFVSGGTMASVSATTISVGSGTGLIRTSNSSTAPVQYFDWVASSSVFVATNTITYIGVTYNSGSPKITTRTDTAWNYKTDFPIGRVVNQSGTLYVVRDPQQVGDHAANMIQREYETMPFARDMRDGGLILSESGDGNRYVAVTAGGVWDRLNRYAMPALNTSSGYTADVYIGATASASTTTIWPNTKYNNGGTLTVMTNNRYANIWVYEGVLGRLMLVYGTAEYTSLALADLELEPSTLPDRIVANGVLLGRIQFKKSDTVASEVDSAFATTFTGGAASNHANLSNLDFISSGHTGFAGTAAANTFSALNIFSAGASVSGRLEIAGTASVSQLYVGGLLYAPFTGKNVTSNSLDFDEFVNSMTLDANTSFALSGNEFSVGPMSVHATGASMSASFGPTTTNAYDLGSQALRWRSIYVSSGSLHIGTTGNEANISYSTSGTQGLNFKPNGTDTALFVGDSGNIGIGTSSPTSKLQISGGNCSDTSGIAFGDTGYLAPSSTGVSFNEWSSPTNAYTSDNTYALGIETTSDNQTWGSFNLSIPSGAGVDGIEVSVEYNDQLQECLSFGCSVEVYLSHDGGSSWTMSKSFINSGSTVDQIEALGDSSDKWGRTWSASDISDGNFLVRIVAGPNLDAFPIGPHHLYVDQVRVNVYYEIDNSGGCTADYAELYPSSENVAKGDILMLDTETAEYSLKKAVRGGTAVGVVSTNPAITIDGGSLNLFSDSYALNPRKPAVALAGRVPVKIDGPVEAGDRLTLSDTPGVATKALRAGMTIGVALESSAGGKTLMFISQSYWAPDVPEAAAESEDSGLFATILGWFRDLLGIEFTGEGRVRAKAVELEGDDGGIYCVRVVGGELVSDEGECGASVPDTNEGDDSSVELPVGEESVEEPAENAENNGSTGEPLPETDPEPETVPETAPQAPSEPESAPQPEPQL